MQGNLSGLQYQVHRIAEALRLWNFLREHIAFIVLAQHRGEFADEVRAGNYAKR